MRKKRRRFPGRRKAPASTLQPASRIKNTFAPDDHGQDDVERVEKAVSGNNDRDDNLGDRVVAAERQGGKFRCAPVRGRRFRRKRYERRRVVHGAVSWDISQLRIIELCGQRLWVVGVDAEALE